MSPDARLAALDRGENPRAVTRLASGWLEMATGQMRKGYCLLLASPKVGCLQDLSPEDALRFLADVDRAARAIRDEVGAVRVNVSIYGNLDPFLHAHLVPRFADEPSAERAKPPLDLPFDESMAWSESRHAGLRDRLKARLEGGAA